MSSNWGRALGTLRKPVRLALFDVDGVLLDSRENMRASWGEVQRQFGLKTPFEDYFALIGRPFADIVSLLGLEGIGDDAARIYFSASKANDHLLRWFPGISDVLSQLSLGGLILGIVTSKDGARTRQLLSSLPVQFATVQTPNGILRGKPAPDHIFAACDEVGADPAETVFTGDMQVDYEAAAQANVGYIHAAWGYGNPPSEDCVSANSAADLPRLIKTEPVQ